MTVATFEMSDREQAVDVAERLFYPSVTLRPVAGAHPFSAHLSAGRIGPSAVGIAVYGCDTAGSVHGDVDAYKALIPLDGTFDVSHGSAWSAATPDFAAVVRPAETSHFRSRGRERVLLLKLDKRAVEAELARMLGRDEVGPVDFQPLLDLRAGRGAQWAHLAAFFRDSLSEPEGMAWNPLMSAQLSSALMGGLLLSTEHRYRESLDARGERPIPASIRRAVDVIEARAHEPLTVPMIAALMSVSVRTLHRGFADHLDTTPYRYLADVRLERAHRDLMAGSPQSTSVTETAHRWGFSNPGRFAATYRARYGTSPSATLADR